MARTIWHGMYERLPVWGQNFACSIAGMQIRTQRYNSMFRKALEFLEQSQWWSLDRQIAYQKQQLSSIVRHAYETVPYYREIFNARKLTPRDIQSAGDLPLLPTLEKTTVRERYEDLLSKAFPRGQCIQDKTGGTTGTAMNLLREKDTVRWQWAIWWRHRKRFGLDIQDPFIVFAGRYVVPLSKLDPPIWRRNLPMKQTYVSVHHMTKSNMPALVEYLQTRRVPFYSGYPSALYLLATYLLENGLRLKHPPRITVTGAESLLPHQRSRIESAFDTEVADQYGSTEHVGNISECEKHSYHVDMEFGVVEFVPIPGLPNNLRRVLLTGFKNRAMPMIRYDIGDVAKLSDVPCSCGREAPTVERIDGRIESYVITPDGRQLGRLDFLFKETKRIVEAQLLQDRLDHLMVKVVRTNGYTDADETSLLSNMRQYLGELIKIDIIYVDQIPKESNGKFRQIVSDVFKDRHTLSSDQERGEGG
jgi:phenylacetate-coenzyme A ligase PaaK-like adenylate-forming protein